MRDASLPWMGRHKLAVSLVVSAVLVLGDCGGSSSGGSGNADKVTASFAQFVHDLQRRNGAAACDGMTPAFRSALAGELNGQLVGVGKPVSASDCRAGLRSLFEMLGQGAIFRTACVPRMWLYTAPPRRPGRRTGARKRSR
jgi:hypothetical protein